MNVVPKGLCFNCGDDTARGIILEMSVLLCKKLSVKRKESSDRSVPYAAL